jgi:hypothetical protein
MGVETPVRGRNFSFVLELGGTLCSIEEVTDELYKELSTHFSKNLAF